MSRITNATITRIIPPPTTDSTGKRTWGSGSALSLRCFADAPRLNQITALAHRPVVASVILYLWKPLAAGVSVTVGSRIVLQVDGSTAITYELVTCDDHEKVGGLSHFECALKGV